MMIKSWKKCKKALQKELSSEEFNAWINPLEFSVNKSPSGSKDLFILAPNAFIKEHVREDDFVARWGGEEFVVIANHAGDKELEKLTKKLQREIAKASFSPAPQPTASFGLTVYLDGDTQESLFKRLDNALYTAKQTGRNKYIIG
jgi:diguanylate cyclase